MQALFVIYADFEYILKEVQKLNKDNAGASYTDKFQEHIACSHSCKVVYINDRFSKPVQA